MSKSSKKFCNFLGTAPGAAHEKFLDATLHLREGAANQGEAHPPGPAATVPFCPDMPANGSSTDKAHDTGRHQDSGKSWPRPEAPPCAGCLKPPVLGPWSSEPLRPSYQHRQKNPIDMGQD